MIEHISANGFSSQHRHTSTNELAKNDIKTIERDTAYVKNEQTQYDPVNKDKIEQVVKGMNDFLNPTQTSLKFELHDELNEYYVTIIDDKSKAVIKEIPSKKLLDFYAAMTDFIGLMVDKKI